MKKKISILLFSCILVNTITSSGVISKAKDTTNDTKINSQKVVDITNHKDYVTSVGEINLSNFDLLLSDEVLEIQPKDNTITVKEKQTMNLLNNEFELSDEIREFLSEKIRSGSQINAIGYSEVALEKDENGDIVPIKKEKYLNKLNKLNKFGLNTYSSGSGFPDSNYTGGEETGNGKLTLMTCAETMNYEGEKYAVGYTVAHWSGISISGKEGPATGADLISITVPNRYVLFDSSFWSQFRNSSSLDDIAKNWRSDEGEHSVIYSFYELKEVNNNYNTFTSSVELTARAKSSDTTSKYEKFTSHYVHTYSDIAISPTISSSGISFGISSSDKAWQLSSSVSGDF